VSDAESLHESATALSGRLPGAGAQWATVHLLGQNPGRSADRKSGGARDTEERSARSDALCRRQRQARRNQSEENWVEVSRAAYQANEKNIGMAIAHKASWKNTIWRPTGPRRGGFAYMAPLSQQRNQYGYWERRMAALLGVVWQYALLRDLLWGHSYRPIPFRGMAK